MMHKFAAFSALATATEGVVHSKSAEEIAVTKTFMSAEAKSEGGDDITGVKDKSATSDTSKLPTPTADQKTKAQQAAANSVPTDMFSVSGSDDSISFDNILAATKNTEHVGAAATWLNIYSTMTADNTTVNANEDAIATAIKTLADPDNLVTGLTFQDEKSNMDSLVTKVCTGEKALKKDGSTQKEKDAFAAVCADDDAKSVKSRLAAISTSVAKEMAKLPHGHHGHDCPECDLSGDDLASYIDKAARDANGKFQKEQVLRFLTVLETKGLPTDTSGSMTGFLATPHKQLDYYKTRSDSEKDKKVFLVKVHALRKWFKDVKADKDVYAGDVKTRLDDAENKFKPIDAAKSGFRNPFTAIAAAVALFILV